MKDLIFPNFYEIHPELNHNSSDFTNNDETLKFASRKSAQTKKRIRT